MQCIHVLFFFTTETSGGFTHFITPVQKITDQSHNTFLESTSVVSFPMPSNMEPDSGGGSIQTTRPVQSTYTSNIPIASALFINIFYYL